MKKILFIFSSLSIISCNKLKDETPKCDDQSVINTVKEIVVENNKDNQVNEIFKEIYGEPWNSDRYINSKEPLELSAFYDRFKNGDTSGIPQNILSKFEEYKNSVEVKNIRTDSKDDVSKSCGCEAEITSKFVRYNNIVYTAQKNSEGQVNVEVYKN